MTASRRSVFWAVGVLSFLVGGSLGWRDAMAVPPAPTPSPAAAPAPLLTAPADEAGEPSTTLELQLHLAGVIEGCGALLSPAAQGTTRFGAHVQADPELGAVVESVEVLDDTIGEVDFSDCVVAATLGAELGEGVVGEVRFRYSAGAPADNAQEFLAGHPALVEQYPALAAIRDRAIDAPRHDADATAFATILASDAVAMAAFEQWSADQGLDLSGVRAEP